MDSDFSWLHYILFSFVAESVSSLKLQWVDWVHLLPLQTGLSRRLAVCVLVCRRPTLVRGHVMSTSRQSTRPWTAMRRWTSWLSCGDNSKNRCSWFMNREQLLTSCDVMRMWHIICTTTTSIRSACLCVCLCVRVYVCLKEAGFTEWRCRSWKLLLHHPMLSFIPKDSVLGDVAHPVVIAARNVSWAFSV